ncbi:MAG: hypothetical protein JNK14_19045 [Chitinophagaceae bacterium]|nr:hypothetical protein [Chitinophagaceae bacterium]
MNSIKKFIYLLFSVSLLSCESQKIKREKKPFDNKIIESSFINDSTFDGPTNYYSTDGLLESTINFTKGIKNGPALNFYPNGKILDSSFYENGVKTGNHYIFDSSGQLYYKNYYYYGHILGGHTFYRNKKPYQYQFRNFEQQIIYSCGYDSLGMTGYNGELINLYLASIKSDNAPYLEMFAYFIHPPTIQIDWSLGLIEENTNIKKDLLAFNNDRVFIDTVLPKPQAGWKYYLAANYNDSLNGIKEYYINILEPDSLKKKTAANLK